MQHGLPASAGKGRSARDRGKATRAWPLGSNPQAGAGLFCHFSAMHELTAASSAEIPVVEGVLAGISTVGPSSHMVA